MKQFVQNVNVNPMRRVKFSEMTMNDTLSYLITAGLGNMFLRGGLGWGLFLCKRRCSGVLAVSDSGAFAYDDKEEEEKKKKK